jgi:ABC-type transport system involved in cytochrome c biogenesis permease subunit
MAPLVSSFMSSWPTLGIAMLVVVILLSYKIEKRSPDLVNRTGVPRWAMLFHTIANLNVARDAQTQRLRKIMLLLLVCIVALFVLVAFAVSTIERPA